VCGARVPPKSGKGHIQQGDRIEKVTVNVGKIATTTGFKFTLSIAY
jgi:hypothetical protein